LKMASLDAFFVCSKIALKAEVFCSRTDAFTDYF
jgi:hypothetical protein